MIAYPDSSFDGCETLVDELSQLTLAYSERINPYLYPQ